MKSEYVFFDWRDIFMVKLLTLDVPDNFLKEEKRDGYFVSKKMKEVWAVELDLLAKFIQVCEKYQLKYFADSGTLLGAARHGGFIPWDDDVDVAMLRKDYDIFCSVAVKEFVYPYYFQVEDTDPGSARKHVQIRNSMTTGILSIELEKHYKFNQGIFIDVFPLDKLPPAKERIPFYNEMTMYRIKSNNFTEEYTRKGDYRDNPYYHLLESCIKRYEHSDGKMIGNLALMNGKRTSNRYMRDYDDVVDLPFEFLTIKAPVGYKNELRRMFGIWKRYKIIGSVHSGILFDTDRSYESYIR